MKAVLSEMHVFLLTLWYTAMHVSILKISLFTGLIVKFFEGERERERELFVVTDILVVH